METPKVAFQINPERLKKQIIYFTVTAQIVNFALEVVMPYVKRTVFRKVKEVKADRAAKRGGTSSPTADDHPEESAFLARVRDEAELDIYDVTGDFREMIVQFGKPNFFGLQPPANNSRISVSLFRHLAPRTCFLPYKQLDRASRRRSQNRSRNPTAGPLARRLHRSLARCSRIPLLARKLDVSSFGVPVQWEWSRPGRHTMEYQSLGSIINNVLL